MVSFFRSSFFSAAARSRIPYGAAAIGLILTAAALLSQTRETAETILTAQFPGTTVSRVTLYLTVDERDALAKCCSESSRVHTFYLAKERGTLKGFGLFDTHIVRTKPQTLFLVMDSSGIVKHVEVAAFLEPRDYLAPARWLALFRGARFGATLDQPGITGATLTVRAVKNAVRRTLELHRIHSRRLQ